MKVTMVFSFFSLTSSATQCRSWGKKNCNAGGVSALRQDEEEEEKRHVFTSHSAAVATTTTANVKKKAATFSSLQQMQVFILLHFNNSSNKTHTHPINEACNFGNVKRVKEK